MCRSRQGGRESGSLSTAKSRPKPSKRDVERIPEAGGDALQLRPVRPAPVDVSPLAAAAERCPVAADQPVIGTEVLAQAEVDVARRVEREPGEPVVGIVARRVERTIGDGNPGCGLAVGLAVAVAILEAVDRIAGRDEERSVAGEGEAHGHLRAFEEGADALEAAVVVGVLEETNPVRRRTRVVLGPEVRVAFDDQDAAARNRPPGPWG